MMAKYRSGSTEVEAIRITMANQEKTRLLLEGIGAFPGNFPMPVRHGKACWWESRTTTNGDDSQVMVLVVSTPDGEIDAFDGDWIVKLTPDLIVPMKPDDFAATYEVV